MAVTDSLTKMPPQRLAIVVGGGVGVGLLWRWYAKRKAGSAINAGGQMTDASGVPVDTSQFALAQNSAGNLGASGSGSSYVPSPNNAVSPSATPAGSFPLPVTKGVVTGSDGIDYYIDSYGNILGPVNPVQAPLPTPTPTPTPAPTPTPTPAPTPAVWSLPGWLTGVKFLKGAGPAVYSVTPNGLEWVPSESAFTAQGGGGSIPGYNYSNPTGTPPVIVSDAIIASLPKIGQTPP